MPANFLARFRIQEVVTRFERESKDLRVLERAYLVASQDQFGVYFVGSNDLSVWRAHTL